MSPLGIIRRIKRSSDAVSLAGRDAGDVEVERPRPSGKGRTEAALTTVE
jgi:hypothetical protein